MKPKSLSLRKILILYYGGLQTAHALLLVVAGWRYWSTGIIGFPAPAARSWSPDAIAFLLATGILDFLMTPLAGILVWMTWRRHPRERAVETVALTGSLYSAGLFFLGTFPSGAWVAHPGSYGVLTFLFLPVILLAVLELKGDWNHEF